MTWLALRPACSSAKQGPGLWSVGWGDGGRGGEKVCQFQPFVGPTNTDEEFIM